MFIRQFSDRKKTIHIINVSSGAGKYPIDGWSTYNASKAGLDMFSLVLNEENNLKGNDNVYIHSIAPGIIDTSMQGIIRGSEITAFSNVEKFKNYFKEGSLTSPQEVAKKFKMVIENPENFPEVIIDVRDF